MNSGFALRICGTQLHLFALKYFLSIFLHLENSSSLFRDPSGAASSGKP